MTSIGQIILRKLGFMDKIFSKKNNSFDFQQSF